MTLISTVYKSFAYILVYIHVHVLFHYIVLYVWSATTYIICFWIFYPKDILQAVITKSY